MAGREVGESDGGYIGVASSRRNVGTVEGSSVGRLLQDALADGKSVGLSELYRKTAVGKRVGMCVGVCVGDRVLFVSSGAFSVSVVLGVARRRGLR